MKMKTNKEIDPKFVQAVDEIVVILKKYDLGASIFLASEKDTHFAHPWNIPTWSTIQYEKTSEGELGIRIRADMQDEQEVANFNYSINMINSFSDYFINASTLAQNLELKIGQFVRVFKKSKVGKGPDWMPPI